MRSFVTILVVELMFYEIFDDGPVLEKVTTDIACTFELPFLRFFETVPAF